ncbi:hypothetical protein AOQ84DRAFT_107626 [Glonium stellatum]|uniref:Uncharacterized protein n=1 Tax=Glonium stellatum TaxID=574774 RepID=A0A8E2JPR9_9PEZI|nr:hypothetical protein AOQ84DRAFT_107626 [Glonium stellatum]
MFGSSFGRPPQPQYEYYLIDDESWENNEAIHMKPPTLRWQTLSRSFPTVPWLISAFFAIVSLYQYLASQDSRGTFKSGWQTEFEPARSTIKLERAHFRGSPNFTAEGVLYISNPDPTRYVGQPSEIIDMNWERLIGARYFLLTESEARQSLGVGDEEDISQYWSPSLGGYVATIGMLHTLDCLLTMRKAFYSEYYSTENSYNEIVYRDYCFEQLRQYIMCYGDLTIIPTVYNEDRDHSFASVDVGHTCRDFQSITEWVSERRNGSLVVQTQCSKGRGEQEGKQECTV